MKKLIFSVAAAALMGLAATGAHAKTLECYQGSGAAGFTSGYNVQYGVIRHLWEVDFRADGYRLEDFVEAVSVPYLPGYSPSEYLRCRDQGLIEGISGALADIAEEVAGSGVTNGTEVGLLNGRLFCGVVGQQSHYGAASRSIPLLTTVAEQACRTSMFAYVNQNCPAKKAMTNFDLNVSLACQFN